VSLLRAAREERGWTQEELATRLLETAGNSPGLPDLSSMVFNVRRWERGATPRARNRALCCAVLHRSQWELFGTGSPPVTELTAVPVPTVTAPASCLVVMLPPGCDQVTVHLAGSATSSADPGRSPAAAPLTLAGATPTITQPPADSRTVTSA
jgi:hypothetical protein